MYVYIYIYTERDVVNIYVVRGYLQIAKYVPTPLRVLSPPSVSQSQSIQSNGLAIAVQPEKGSIARAIPQILY